MKRLMLRLFWIGLWLSLVGLSCHVAWLVWRTETGGDTLRLHWRDATVGWFKGEYVPISARHPVEQAEYWLHEVDRVLATHPENGAQAAGAALVLDEPGFSNGPFFGRKPTPRSPTFDMKSHIIELLRVGESFEALCRRKCLELSALASELDATNVAWWRLRAVLLWDNPTWTLNSSLRDPNWTAILEQCSEHDPDNALYDYLATNFWWDTSAEMDYTSNEERLLVKDAETFQRGVDYFERGLKKPKLVIGDVGFSAVAEFLAASNLPRLEHDDVIRGRFLYTRRDLLFYRLWTWQDLHADREVDAGDLAKAWEMQRQSMRLIEQYRRADPSHQYSGMATACRYRTAIEMVKFAAAHPERFSSEELRELTVAEERARLDGKVHERSQSLFAARDTTATGSRAKSRTAKLLSETWIVLAPSLVLFALLFSLAATGISRLSKREDFPKIGPMWQGMAFMAAGVFSIFMFGVLPSKIVSARIQGTVFIWLLVGTVLGTLACKTWRGMRRRAYRFSLRELLFAMTALSMVLALAIFAQPTLEYFHAKRWKVSLPTLGWEWTHTNDLENAMRRNGVLFGILDQWTAYGGAYLTIVIWGIAIAVWLRRKLRRARQDGDMAHISRRDILAAVGRSLARPALILSALVLAIYLALVPHEIEAIEQEFQTRMAFARDPAAHWAKVERAVEQVRSDPEEMDLLRDIVRQEMAEERDESPHE